MASSLSPCWMSPWIEGLQQGLEPSKIARPPLPRSACSIASRPSRMSAYACAHGDDVAGAGVPPPLPGVGGAKGGGVSWDPEGLLPPPDGSLGGHFARRERGRRGAGEKGGKTGGDANAPSLETAGSASAPVAALLGDSREVRSIPAEWVAAGGAPVSSEGVVSMGEFATLLATRYVAVDLAFPGLRVQNVDPPVLTVDNFLSADECREIVEAAQHSGRMEASKVGAGNVVSDLSELNPRRTSSSMLLDPATLEAHPRLKDAAGSLQRAIWRLLLAGEGEGWGRAGRLPAPNQFCFESLQVAEYRRGQHFLAHEDAFPVEIARENGFQRHATVLVYLNDVPEGGRTVFDQVGVAVKPEVGKALLFFPSFSDSTPDTRTLHTAEAALDTKWVTQQWIACGVSQKASVVPAERVRSLQLLQGRDSFQAGAPMEAADAIATDLGRLKSGVRELKKAKKGLAKKGAGRGFGSKG